MLVRLGRWFAGKQLHLRDIIPDTDRLSIYRNMTMSEDEITQLLTAWQAGDNSVESRLFDALYQQIHRIALRCLASEPPACSLGAMSLVHEAYLRFRQSTQLQITNRQHFLSLIAKVMQQILVDRARRRLSAKRSGERHRVDLDERFIQTDRDADQILSVDAAMRSLAQLSQRQASVVQLRFFAGFTEDEAAEVLGLSARQVRRDWRVARVRLQLAINGPEQTASKHAAVR